MSNDQEMEFADPAWQAQSAQDANQEQGAPAPQPIWTPPAGREMPRPTSGPEQEYAQGYQAQTPPFSDRAQPFQQTAQQQPFPPQPTRAWNIPGWIWWLVAALVLSGIVQPIFSSNHFFSVIGTIAIVAIIWLLVSRRVRVNLSGERQAPETRSFNVSANPTLFINNKAGSINLHAGQAEQVTITTTRRGYLFNQRLNRDSQVWYNQDQAANTVSARVDDWRPFGKNSVDFDITVPPRANLELTTNMGSIHVQNVAGRMKLQADAGVIRATQTTLTGKSLLKTDAGSIDFTGSLDPNGDYTLSTDMGTVTVNLPADVSLQLDAKTDLGNVTTNLPLSQNQRTKASGQVGVGPHPRLKLRTNLGSIQVYRH
jgi:hypothetical protein